jgi:hypothetical protein
MHENLNILRNACELALTNVRAGDGVDESLRSIIGEAFRATKAHPRQDKRESFSYWLGALDFAVHASPNERAAAAELDRLAHELVELANERDGPIAVWAFTF